MSFGGIENSFIVKKSKNFTKKERNETGYNHGTEKQIASTFSHIELIAGLIRPSGLYLNNC